MATTTIANVQANAVETNEKTATAWVQYLVDTKAVPAGTKTLNPEYSSNGTVLGSDINHVSKNAAAPPPPTPPAPPVTAPPPVEDITDRPPHIVRPGVRAPNPDPGKIEKITDYNVNYGQHLEIRPPIRRLPHETPFFVEMLDANMQPCGIQLPDGTVVQALRLAPNPDNLTVGSNKIVNRYNTMTRWVEEHWGDDMDTVSFSGSTFSFMAIVPPGDGLTVTNRSSTKSYQMLKALINFYRMNGCIYQDNSTYFPSNEIVSPVGYGAVGTLIPNAVAKSALSNVQGTAFLMKYPDFEGNHPRAGLVRERLYIRLAFDYVSFIGYFESFDMIEDAANPFKLTYNALLRSERTEYVLG